MNHYSTQDSILGFRALGGNVVYDLTGANGEFRKSFVFCYYKGPEGASPSVGVNDQTVEIPLPAWLAVPNNDGENAPITTARLGISIEFEKMFGAAGEISTDNKVVYVSNDDFENESLTQCWTEVEVCEPAMAEAHVLWNDLTHEFNGKLIRAIKIRLPVKKANVTVTYQAFLKDVVDTENFRDAEGPVYTRDLGKMILDKLDELDAKTDVVARNLFGTTAATTDILDEDLTGLRTDNYIQNELHVVDTRSGKTLLSPAKGSFYPGSDEMHNSFKMYLYKTVKGVVNQDVVDLGTYNGWEFVYTVNNMTVYVEATGKYQENRDYFKVDAHGDFVKMIAGTDYTVGANIVGDVYVTKRVPFDPTNSFDGAVHDSSAVITSQRSVILTAENVGEYLNYSGTFVDVGLITLGETNGSVALTYGVDYTFANTNFAKTKKTYSTQPVYDHVRLLTDIVTDAEHRVGISYQAYGGQVLPSDVRNIRQDLTNLLDIVARHHLITAENLEKHQVINAILSRLRRIEDYHYHHNRVDQVVPMGLTGFQWFNIAKVDDAQWTSGPHALRDIGTFRVTSRELGWTYEFVATVDLTADSANRLAVTVVGATGQKTVSVDDFDSILRKEIVGVRLIWMGDGSDGAVLQIGFDCSKYRELMLSADAIGERGEIYDTDVLTVTNKSGDTSSWKLFYNPTDMTMAADQYVNVYSRCKYKTVNSGTIDQNVLYYNLLPDTYYFKTDDLAAVTSKHYYYTSEDSNVVQELEVAVGTVFATAFPNYTIYEQATRGSKWNRATVTTGAVILPSSNLWVVDQNDSTDSSYTVLPNGKYWGESTSGSRQEAKMLERVGNGVIVWAGAIALSSFAHYPTLPNQKFQLHFSITDVMQQFIDPLAVRRLELVIYDRKDNKFFSTYLDMSHNDADDRSTVAGEQVFYLPDLCGINAEVSYPEPVEMTAEETFHISKNYFTFDDATGTYQAYDATSRLGGMKNPDETFYVEPRVPTAYLEVGLGTSSAVNERFDLRLARLHF